MDKYIECEAAIAIIEEKQKELCPIGKYSRNAVYGSDREKFDELQEIIDAIESITAADVVEVRYGRWIDHEKDGFPLPTTCSRCFYPIDRFYKSNYCPSCGADMREQENDGV